MAVNMRILPVKRIPALKNLNSGLGACHLAILLVELWCLRGLAWVKPVYTTLFVFRVLWNSKGERNHSEHNLAMDVAQ